MTNKEAKKIIYNQWQAFLEDNIDYAGISEAYKMAIKALEAQPCEDCISRQKALDCFEQTNTRQGAKYAIETLPPVTPQRPKGKWINDNCSICGYGVRPWNNTPYCPNCGAEMEVENADSD